MRLVQSQLGIAVARLQQAHSGLLPTVLLQGVATDGPQGAPTFGPLENPGLLGTNPMSLEGLAADPLKKQYGAGLTINQTLFDYGRTQHLVSARSNLVDAAREDASSQIASLLLSVEQSYYGVLRAVRHAEVSAQNLKQREATLAQAKALVEGQIRSGVDLQIALANAAEAKSLLMAAQNELRYAFAQLNHAMGETSLTEYRLTPALTGSVEDSEPKTGDEAMDRASHLRPEVLGAQKQTRASDQLMKGIRSELMPRLDAIASVGSLRPSSLLTGDKNYAVGITLSIPIFSGGYVEGRLSEERQRKTSTIAQEDATKETVRLQAAKAWLEFETRKAQLVSAEEQAKAAGASLRLASERYQLRLSSIIELTQAETLAIQSDSQLADALYEISVAKASLDWATGHTYQKYLAATPGLRETKKP